MLPFEYNFRWVYAHHFLRDVFEFAKHFDFSLGKVTYLGIEYYDDWEAELESFRESNYLLVSSAFRDIFPSIRWWMDM